ncbi:MAG: tRNA pseudouridine(55) synthase TruB [Clostridiaceae bacterium]|nr:tRNA pseudouridine(55) synthase TruB [Clostridiaceae bacterium]
MDGIINVLKPPGMTSFDVVAVLRGLTGVRRIGHAGTLDPMAAGVLPVCIGRAAKAIEFLMEKDKRYRAELTLGITTDTQDTTGTITSSKKPEVSDQQIADAVSAFEGKYLQVPPMHSAVRVDGKRLYELAREGVEIERQQREVEIFSAKLLSIDRSEGVRALIDIHCSKGTYIRTLCSDIGDRLGCGGCMSFLLRMAAGPFEISDSITLEELSALREKGGLHNALIGVDRVFAGLEAYRLDEASEKRFGNGMQIPLSRALLPDTGNEDRSGLKSSVSQDGSLVRVYGSNGDFIALGMVFDDAKGYYLKVRKFFKIPVGNERGHNK